MAKDGKFQLVIAAVILIINVKSVNTQDQSA
jgi:hypothetical protein